MLSLLFFSKLKKLSNRSSVHDVNSVKKSTLGPLMLDMASKHAGFWCWLSGIALVAGLLPASVMGAGPYQDVARIVEVAKQFALTQSQAQHDGDVEIATRSLDSRLRLARCDRPLEAFAAPGSRRIGQTSVGVRCSGEQPWKLYVPVEIQVFGKVVRAARGLPRGVAVTSSDLAVQRHNLAQLPHGYLTDPKQAVGKMTRRSLRAGQVLTHTAVKAPEVVARGQSVVIAARKGALAVRTSGEALGSGAQGERVRVRNISSGRVVEGVIVAPGQVEVDL